MSIVSPLAGPLGQAVASVMSPPGGAALALARPGFLLPSATVSRAGAATVFDEGGALQAAAADAPRYTSSVVLGRNLLRNPRAEGGTLNTPGSLPNHWGVFSAGGLVTTMVAKGTDEATGLPYVDLRIAGTTTQTFYVIAFDTTAVAAAPGEVWTESLYAALVGGSLAGVTLNVNLRPAGGSGTNLTAPFTPGPALSRVPCTGTMGAGVTALHSALGLSFANGATIDLTLRLAAPQTELAAAPGAVSLPPVGQTRPSEARAAGRLLVEEARTNRVSNPRGEGAAAGSPGTMPTGWGAATTNGGLSRSVAGVSSANGVSSIDIRVQGTTTGASVFFTVASFGNTAAAANQTWAASSVLSLVGGSVAGLSLRHEVARFGAAMAYLGSNVSDVVPDATPRRLTYATTPADASLTAVGYNIQLFVAAAGTAVDFTLRVSVPQLEQGGAASSVILPAAGSPAATARAADDIAFDLAAAPWFRQGAGSLLVEAVLPNGLQAMQPLLALNDGSAVNDSNSLTLRVNAAGSQVIGVAKAAGAQTNTGGSAPLAPAALVRAGIAWDGTGYAIVVDGQPVQSSAGALPAAFGRLAIGRLAVAGSGYANAEFRRVEYRPARLPDAVLRALTAP